MDTERLRACLRAYLAGDRTLPPLDEAGWAAACEHRLAGTLYHMRVPLGHVARRSAERSWAGQAAAHLRRAARLAEVWPAHGPPPLVFKGADLVENLYGDPGARRMSDLDLLVPPDQYEAVLRALAPAADASHRPRTERLPGEGDYERGLVFGEDVLELHRALQPVHRGGPDPRSLWDRGQAGRFGDVAVRFPHPEDRWLIWLTNVTKGSLTTDLTDWLDLGLLLRALPTPRPWMRLLAAARAAGLGRPAEVCLRRFARLDLWPEPLPAVESLGAALSETLLRAPDAPAGEPAAWRFQALKLLLAPSERRPAIILRLGVTAASRAAGRPRSGRQG